MTTPTDETVLPEIKAEREPEQEKKQKSPKRMTLLAVAILCGLGISYVATHKGKPEHSIPQAPVSSEVPMSQATDPALKRDAAHLDTPSPSTSTTGPDEASPSPASLAIDPDADFEEDEFSGEPPPQPIQAPEHKITREGVETVPPTTEPVEEEMTAGASPETTLPPVSEDKTPPASTSPTGQDEVEKAGLVQGQDEVSPPEKDLASFGYSIKPSQVGTPPEAEDAHQKRLAALAQTPAYQNMVTAVGIRVGQNWKAPEDYEKHGAQVRVKVAPDGVLTGFEVIRSSHNDAYNKSVISAAVEASPFIEIKTLPAADRDVVTEFTLNFGRRISDAEHNAANAPAPTAQAEEFEQAEQASALDEDTSAGPLAAAPMAARQVQDPLKAMFETQHAMTGGQ
ncbi:TonB C-terminal domain-containing protein [Pseudomonas luteola]|uniref:TonB C-terminal domain-containing protein n=1 Tax=Pseudomonas luteola TaxID=47886 RepID=A0ABS0FS74_PSELU|nr:TonB C-terminal domain-containing protein [Pseudomonas zeshuii]MBF8643139.1 TonB C-terminal domain-containing protein [Pseudomonas zeshuii]